MRTKNKYLNDAEIDDNNDQNLYDLDTGKEKLLIIFKISAVENKLRKPSKEL